MPAVVKNFLLPVLFVAGVFLSSHSAYALQCINPYNCQADGTCQKDIVNDYPCDCSSGYTPRCEAQGVGECGGQYCSLGEMCVCDIVYSYPAPPPSPVNGACGGAPTHYQCSAGSLGPTEEWADQWRWWCMGSDGGSNQFCSEAKPYSYPAPAYGYPAPYGYEYEYQYPSPGYSTPAYDYQYQYQYEYQYQTPAAEFNYSLSNSGNSSATKSGGNVFTQNTITKTLVAGTAQSVSLSVSGVPSGVSYVLANGTCSPTCQSTLTFTVSPSAPVGTHAITVTGSPLNKTTNFNLIISANPITVTCSAFPSPAVLGETVTWTGTVTGGTAPYTYSWSGTGIPTDPAPSTNPFSIRYTTVGAKYATLTVTDDDDIQSSCGDGSGGGVLLYINFNPKFEEF